MPQATFSQLTSNVIQTSGKANPYDNLAKEMAYKDSRHSNGGFILYSNRTSPHGDLLLIDYKVEPCQEARDNSLHKSSVYKQHRL